MILVEALNTYEKNNIKDKELHRIPKCGERFEVNENRLKELLGDNDYQLIFVKKIDEKKAQNVKTKNK